MNADSGRSTLALWEIVSVVVSCLIAEWVVLAFVGANKIILALPIALAVALMIFSHRVYNETPHELGFRVDNLRAAAFHCRRCFTWRRNTESFRPYRRPAVTVRFGLTFQTSWK